MNMEQVHNNPSELHSYLVNEVVHASAVELNRKRKILDKQLSLPIRKLNFRNGSTCSDHSSLFVGEPEGEDVPQKCTFKVNNNASQSGVESIQVNSEVDSNSITEESDCAMSHYIEANSAQELPKACGYYKPDLCDKPSTSSGSCDGNDSKNMIYSIDKNFKTQHIKEDLPFMDDQNLGFEYHTDNMCSDHGNGEIMESPVAEPEDTMLYSNGVSSDMFVLSSGRWEINQDPQAGIRKPTIDQEFEQYFSMLML